MADDKLKQELLYMASLASKYDFSKMEVVEGILRLENERKILDSVFGRRFKSRIFVPIALRLFCLQASLALKVRHSGGSSS